MLERRQISICYSKQIQTQRTGIPTKKKRQYLSHNHFILPFKMSIHQIKVI